MLAQLVVDRDGDRRLVVTPSPATRSTSAARSSPAREVAAAAAARGARLPARPRRASTADPGARGDLLAQLPEQPDRRRRPARLSSSARPSSRREHGFLLASDEAYTELWFDEPPHSALEVATARQRRRLQHALQALVDDRLPLRVRGGRRGADRCAEAVPAVRRHRAAGVRPARVGRRLERRGARRAHARALPPQARVLLPDARAQGRPRRRQRGDDVPLARGARRRDVGGVRRAAARARADRLARDVLRPVRRGLLSGMALVPHRGGVPARGGDPEEVL